MSTWQQMAHLKTIFSLDLRSLALFRIGLGLLLISDLLTRFSDIEAHYTDFGILPRDVYLDKFANSFHVSLHLASGKEWWQILLLVVAFVAATALLMGYKSRLAAVVSWILLISIHNRNPVILNGGDVLLRLLLFWSLFLPLGARYSVDAALADHTGEQDHRYFGGPSIALTLQVVLVYISTFLLKTGNEWWPDGTASYYALALDQLANPIGIWLRQFTDLLRISTYGVYTLELAAPFLLLSPFFFLPCRMTGIVALIGMHLGFEVTMNIGLFPWIDTVSLMALTPTAAWDWLAQRVKGRTGEKLKIYYDGDCNFCKKMVRLVRTALLLPDAPLLVAQDDARTARILKKEFSWIVIDETDTHHIRFEAMVVLLEHSLLTGWLVRRLPLRKLNKPGNRVYNLVAHNRQHLGRLTARFLPYRPLPNPTPSHVTNLVTLFLIGYVGLWNIKNLPDANIYILPEWKPIGYLLRLDQKWNMFAPYPTRDDGWYVIDGKLKDGTKVDVYNGLEQDVSWERPKLLSDTFKNSRWRKYLMNIWRKSKRQYRLYYGKYLCRSWNRDKSAERKLATFEINFMLERSPPPGETAKVEKVRIWSHDCLKKSSKD